jgi:putative heme transporter
VSHQPASTDDDGRVPSWLNTSAAWMWRLLVLIVGAGAILMLLTRLYLVSLPIIVALILSTLLVPIARALERRRVPRMLAAVIAVFGSLALFSGFIALLTPAFVEQVQDLGPTVTEGVDQFYVFLEENFGWDQEEVLGLLDQAIAAVQEQSGEVARQVVSGAAIAVQALAAIALALVLLFFFVKDGEQIVDWMIDRSPATYAETIRAVGRRAWNALAGFVRGTAAVALVDAIGIGVGLAILDVPLVLPIAVLVFFGGFIPVIGAFVTGLLAVLVALADGGLQTGLIVLAIVVAVQQFESNVLQPVIMRRAVRLHPVVILAALTGGAALIGIVGAFLAVPVAAVASAVGNELRLRHEASLISAGDVARNADPGPEPALEPTEVGPPPAEDDPSA